MLKINVLVPNPILTMERVLRPPFVLTSVNPLLPGKLASPRIVCPRPVAIPRIATVLLFAPFDSCIAFNVFKARLYV